MIQSASVAEIQETTVSEEPLRFERRTDSQTWAIRNGEETAVRVLRCFPWTSPRQYISFRDHEDNEVALVTDLDELDEESVRVAELALVEAGFVMEIESVISLEDEFEIRNWKVETRQGQRTFQTKCDDWPREMESGGLLFRDVAGDLFLIAEPDRLDERSRRLLSAFLD